MVTRLCLWLSVSSYGSHLTYYLKHFYSSFVLYHFMELFKAWWLLWATWMFCVTCAGTTTQELCKQLFNHWNGWCRVPLVFIDYFFGFSVLFILTQRMNTWNSLFPFLLEFTRLSVFNGYQTLTAQSSLLWVKKKLSNHRLQLIEAVLHLKLLRITFQKLLTYQTALVTM